MVIGLASSSSSIEQSFFLSHLEYSADDPLAQPFFNAIRADNYAGETVTPDRARRRDG